MAPPKPRLTDWQPLSDTDPVPGDPQAVRDEIKHLNSVKDELNKQADRLKGIRDDDELRGKYATTLKEEAEVLEGQLRDLAKRYGRVVVPLGKWATELEQFQSEADTVCGRAAARQEELDAEDKAAKEKNPDPRRPTTRATRCAACAPTSPRCCTSGTPRATSGPARSAKPSTTTAWRTPRGTT
ncbi:hypothetical protein FE156_18230 [Streptomyces albidoflavus]|nr:hypothetical protein FE156_18230 [Streptomyces albidoflavus]